MTVNLPAFTSDPPQIHQRKTTLCTPFSPKPPAKTPVIQPQKNTEKRSLFGVRLGCSRKGGEAQGGVVFVEFEAEGFDDEVVVVALGQA